MRSNRRAPADAGKAGLNIQQLVTVALRNGNVRAVGNGAEGQNRTADTMIFSHVLYRLSYLGTKT